MDLTDYPWVLYCQYDGKGAFVPEEGFTSLKDAQKARAEYKAENPKDKFVINSIIEH